MDDDAALEAIWKSENSLAEFIDPKNFKTYEELQTKLNRVLGLDGAAPSSTAAMPEAPAPTPAREKEFAPTPQATMAPQTETSDDDDDESLEFFKKLAQD